MLRGMMLALFVASEAFKGKDSRHELMRVILPAIQEAVVDELMRQHNDIYHGFSSGAKRFEEEYIDDDEGVEELTRLRRWATAKVVARDFFKKYGNSQINGQVVLHRSIGPQKTDEMDRMKKNNV